MVTDDTPACGVAEAGGITNAAAPASTSAVADASINFSLFFGADPSTGAALVFVRTANGANSVAPIDLMDVFFIFFVFCGRTQPSRGRVRSGFMKGNAPSTSGRKRDGKGDKENEAPAEVF